MRAAFDWSSFVEVPGFLARWEACGCDDGDLRRLQLDLLMDPTGWPVVPTAGFRRRWCRTVPVQPSDDRRGTVVRRIVRANSSDFAAVGRLGRFGRFSRQTARIHLWRADRQR